MDAQQRQVVGCVTPVISLQKLKDFFVQPKFRSIVPYDFSVERTLRPLPHQNTRPASSLEESRTAALEASHLHNLYGNHSSNRNANNSSPPVSSSSSSSMLVVPQPVSATSSKNPGALNAANTANGTGRKYQCKMCPQIFGSKADLQLHTQIHMREAKPYKCSQCSKAFANSSYLSQHTRIHLGIKPYRCEICQRKFTQLSHLQQHIRTHTGDKPYKCRHPGCNKAFSQLSNLQSHSRCHQTDKPYKCNSCYKCFGDEASLLEHIPKHKESKHLKTHICQYCGKSYTQETYLAKHMQKHADRIEKRGAQPPVVAPPPQSRIASQQNPASSENFWSKTATSSNDVVAMMDSRGAGSHHVHVSDSSSCLQPPPGMDHSRLHLSARDMDHRQTTGMGRGDHTDMSHMAQLSYDAGLAAGSKTTSAFTPIQTGMLPITSSAQLGMPGSSRTYFPYEPISFPKAPPPPPPPPMENKPPHSSFPNQLISLHQIRNYAAMPNIGGGEHPISLKDKGHQ